MRKINYLGIFRPSKAEVDALAELGCAGWTWESLLHYMKKVRSPPPPSPPRPPLCSQAQSETLQRKDLSAVDAARFAADPDAAFHGHDGAWSVCLRREAGVDDGVQAP